MKMLCNIPDTVIVHGIPSHKIYKFNNENNHILEISEISTENCDLVNREDVNDLLSKTKKQGCCGKPIEIINIFTLIE